mgnify:FL=1
MPDKKFDRFKKDYGLPDYDTEILTRERELADYFEEAVRVGKAHDVLAKQIANTIINKKFDYKTVLPAQLVQAIISSTATVSIDEKEIEKIIKKVLEENIKAVEDYKKGKESSLQFLVGQVMRLAEKKIDGKILVEKIKRAIQK